MIDWIVPAVPLIKVVHIVGLVVWIGGMLALPLMLTRHDPAISLEDYRIIRRASHMSYTLCVTPAAVVAVVAGTWLIFLREVFSPWLYAKLAMVALLVLAHGWIGHTVAMVGEEPSDHKPPASFVPISLVLLLVVAILFLVLAKPALEWIVFPVWLTEPQDRQLLFDVPSR